MVRDNHELFPLNGCRRFAGYVVGDSIDTPYFIDDPAGDFFE